MSNKHFLNIKKIVEDRGGNKTEIGKLLFPDNKFPARAFSRVLTGKAELSASQVSILAERLGCDVSDLYEPDRWAKRNTEGGKQIFIYGINFRVELDPDTREATIYYKNEIIKSGVFYDAKTTIDEFLNSIKACIQDWMDFA